MLVDATPIIVTPAVESGSSPTDSVSRTILTSPGEPQSQPSSSYHDNKCDEIDGWRAIERDLIRTKQFMDVLSSSSCSTCGHNISQPIIQES